jgi:peptidoglycan/xylan/chitin deacetylase (PgdA/CDA1 family)
MLTNFLERTRFPENLVPQGSRSATRSAEPAAVGTLSIDEIERRCNSLEQPLTDTPLDETLTEINRTIDLLRFERYAQTASREQSSSVKAAVRNVYYLLRPLFPVAFRKHLQRIALRGWDAKSFPSWPVDIRTEKLMDTVWRRMLDSSGLQALPFIWFWPDGHSSACIMTHDVETKFGRDFCGEMMRMERRHGVVSAFEVVPEERYEVPSSFLDEIREMGCEVCIHGLNHDGHDFTSRELFLERAKKINAYAEEWGARGYRSPVLYRNLEWINALKFSYDLSVPNVGHLDPQPGGCCTVMPYFIGEMLELPLTTIQDYSLFNILQQRSLDLWAKQISLIREQHGLISFIIHPDYVQDPWAKDLYDGLLQYLAELRNSERVWIALPRDVDDWWRARREMQLIQKNGNWVIQGPQAERARVAYASMEGGRLTFSVENRG